MDRLSAYGMFVQVARSGSFTGAARQLGQPPQAITRGIAALEAHLGVRLFQRSTRAVSLTTEGAGLLPRIERLLGDLAESERAATGMLAEPRGELAITAPVAFGQLHVVPVVGELLALHPELDVRLMLIDRNVRLIEEGIDLAVRIGALEDSTLRARRIGTVREVIVASPAYLARQGVPGSPADLAGHDLIASTGPRGAGEWRMIGPSGQTGARRRLRVNSVAAAIEAAEAGVGLANFLSYQVANALAAGRLVEVLRTEPIEPIPVNLVFDPARAASAGTRAFIEAMVRRAARGGWG
ncbi:LysR family transcriptional regulator [Novosphingobium ginsenosidimutans]|uniref:LysR family transcriptional regulator n=1 Tax=Novosphingobium ginsenosidimutans TaxID=1176536 RepID=A0A5B8S5Q1_9SPHN|nr:LysR family transcriptional regulator [Novosphingobium ginsenosidimutans]QEA16077.1 LysR family transcriptional regulator [Novosphingobium ginsenosidimutans]